MCKSKSEDQRGLSTTKICIRFFQARPVQLVFARTVPVKIGKKFNAIFTDEKVIGSQAIVNLNDFVDLYRKSQDIANQLMLSQFIKPLSGQFRAALVPHRILISMRRAVSAILLDFAVYRAISHSHCPTAFSAAPASEQRF